MAPPRSQPPASAFGAELDRVLETRGLSQTDLATQAGVSSAYVSSVRTGKRNVSGERVDGFADVLNLDASARARLHRAAARDAGFRLDLPDDF